MPKTQNPIDWKACLNRCNNNANAAQDLLDMLATDLPKLKQTILAAYQNNNTEDLKHHIHKLNGACACCGASELQSQAAAIENELKNGQKKPKIAQIQTLTKQIDQTQQAIQSQSYVT